MILLIEIKCAGHKSIFVAPKAEKLCGCTYANRYIVRGIQFDYTVITICSKKYILMIAHQTAMNAMLEAIFI